MKDFLFTLLAWLFTLPILILSIGFALLNSDPVPVILTPASNAIVLPLYAPVLVGAGAGFFLGALMTWAAFGRLRQEKRALRRQLKATEHKLHQARHHQPVRHNYALVPPALQTKQIL